MWCYDGAKVWQLVGFDMLKQLKHSKSKESTGLYGNDGNRNKEVERKRKQIVQLFKELEYLSPCSATWNRGSFWTLPLDYIIIAANLIESLTINKFMLIKNWFVPEMLYNSCQNSF